MFLNVTFLQTEHNAISKVWTSGESTNEQYMNSMENIINKITKNIFSFLNNVQISDWWTANYDAHNDFDRPILKIY